MKEEKETTGYSLFEIMHKPELAQFVPPEENMTNKRCEKCKFYCIIDSGYGYCRRFPPQEKRENFFSKSKEICYPRTEWYRKCCGEFIIKDIFKN